MNDKEIDDDKTRPYFGNLSKIECVAVPIDGKSEPNVCGISNNRVIHDFSFRFLYVVVVVVVYFVVKDIV